MTLCLLLRDELRHLARSRVVVIVLASMPALMAVASMAQTGEGTSPLIFAAFMGSSLAGLVCGAMISTSLIGELQQGTPVLFAIRPFPRFYFLLARFLAMVLTLFTAMALALAAGSAISAWLHPEAAGTLAIVRSGLVLSLASAFLSGSFGVLVGVASGSMLGGVLLFLFVGVQLTNGTMLIFERLPRWTGWSPAQSDAAILAGASFLAVAMLAVAGCLFARRPL